MPSAAATSAYSNPATACSSRTSRWRRLSDARALATSTFSPDGGSTSGDSQEFRPAQAYQYLPAPAEEISNAYEKSLGKVPDQASCSSVSGTSNWPFTLKLDPPVTPSTVSGTS